MATRTSMIHVRIDDTVKEQASAALATMGLSVADAVRILFHRIVADQALPLELKVPNAATRAAMAEADEIMSSGKMRFEDARDMVASLEEGGH